MAGGRKASSSAAAAVVLAVSLMIAAVATTGAGAMTICGVDESAVDACRSFAEANSTEDSPSPLCCEKLENADFSCLCDYRSFLPSDIDADRVMMLPAKCNIPAPPNLCN